VGSKTRSAGRVLVEPTVTAKLGAGVDIDVRGRGVEIGERFRAQVEEKLGRIERLDSRVSHIEVDVSQDHAPHGASKSVKVELTCVSVGPVVRAEASDDTKYAALDAAYDRLEERVRRATSRRRDRWRGKGHAVNGRSHPNGSTPGAAASNGASPAPDADDEAFIEQWSTLADDATESKYGIVVDGDGPLVVREKLHATSPMTLDQAFYEMELVGHTFYAFVDKESGHPSVLYRRRGYDYGVIRLDVQG
jgi:ribosomal subunit interface protein